MVRAITVRVLTNEGQVASSDEAVAIRAPGALGSMGILYNHAPLVTVLDPGIFMWRCSDGAIRRMRVGEGLLEIVRNRCTILTSSVSEAEVSGYPE